MSIGSKIKEIRLSKGLTQKQLGDLCGMADSAIRRYESDRGNPTEKTLSRIADALGVYLAELVPTEDLEKISPYRLIADSVSFYYEKGQNDPNIQKAFEQFKNEAGFRVEVGFNESENKPIYDIFLLDDDERLITAFNSLNDEGKQVAIERIEELTHIPKYQRTEPPETILDGGEYRDTTKAEKPPEGQETPSDGK